jgi:hypothetical protein
MPHSAAVHPLALLGNGIRSLGTLPTGEEVYHLPRWGKVGDVGRLKIIRKLIKGYGRDPRLRTMATGIMQGAKVAPRDYIGQANSILCWARGTVPYVNEPGELLQSPWYSLGLDKAGQKVRPASADCDDFVLLIGSLLESIRLPTRLVLSGVATNGSKVRYIEGHGKPQRGVKWSHIYLMVGTPPFQPTAWTFMEPTLNVPIGWEVVKDGQRGVLPEMAGPYGALVSPPVVAPEITEAIVVVDREERKAAALRWIRSLPWAEIIAGTLPMVFSAIMLDRYYKGRK